MRKIKGIVSILICASILVASTSFTGAQDETNLELNKNVILNAPVHNETYGSNETVNGSMAAIETVNIQGLQDTYFNGGDFYLERSFQFGESFEGDGSNGTNGTVPWINPNTGEQGGLMAVREDGGITFKGAGLSNPGRGKALMETIYQLPQIEQPNKPYYLELSFKILTGGAVTFNFGADGDSGAVHVRKKDDFSGTTGAVSPPEGPAAYNYIFGGNTLATSSFASNQDTTIGFYVIPAINEMVLYKNRQKVADNIFTYATPGTPFKTLKVTWYQSIRYTDLPKNNYLTLRKFNIYHGPDIPDKYILGFDKGLLTLASLTAENPGQITRNLNLPSKGNFGTTIIWNSSDNEAINPQTGSVIRGETDKAVTLLATLVAGNITETLEFQFIVQRKLTEGNILLNKKVEIDTASIEDISHLTDGSFLSYIETMDGEKKPSFIIDLEEKQKFSSYILYEGEIDDAYSILNGVIEVSNDKISWEKVADTGAIGDKKIIEFLPVNARYIKFKVDDKLSGKTVKIFEAEAVMNASDESIIKADKNALKAFDSYYVSASTVLPTKGEFGSDISWESSRADIISPSGTITKPAQDTLVTLTASLKYGSSASQTKTFNYMVSGGKISRNGGGSSGGGGKGGSSVSGSGKLVDTVYNEDSVIKDPPPDKPNPVFSDVDKTSWAYPYIIGLYEAGIIEGSAKGTFDPKRLILREEYLKLLLSVLKFDLDKDITSAFDDVSDQAWFAAYVNTAAKLGIVQGITETSFGTGKEITRQDMAVMMKRAMELKGVALDKSQGGNEIADADLISNYALESVLDMVKAGFVSGDENGRFQPFDFATREQAAKLIYMLSQQV